MSGYNSDRRDNHGIVNEGVPLPTRLSKVPVITSPSQHAPGWYYNNPTGQGVRFFRDGTGNGAGVGARFMPRTMSAAEWAEAVADKAPTTADKDRAGPVAYGEGKGHNRWRPVYVSINNQTRRASSGAIVGGGGS
jgi:hypothetical protein